jgi:glycosyltransferase involved in cell wall biosynthesis
MTTKINFSVLISVYTKDRPEDFRTALESITSQQTLKPSEVVLVVDGPVSDDTNSVIIDVGTANPGLYKIVRFEKNRGLGIALQIGLEAASNDIVMRMDSDDIAVSDRFDKQYQFMVDHPNVAVCGGQIDEFIDDVNNIVGRREVPCSNNEIYSYMTSRCAFNHMTVALRRSKILEVGNYQPWFWNEDLYLWVRLMIAKYEFANLPDTLVKVRVGKEMYKRRGGNKYFRSELGIQKLMRGNNLTSWPRYCFNVIARWGVQVAMPNWLRGFIFQKLFRK